MSTIANITNTTGEFINRITDLDIDITITTSLLSIIGACVIFLTFALKWKNSETDRELMTFLVCLTIADLFIAVGYLTGQFVLLGPMILILCQREYWRVTKEKIPDVSHRALLQQCSACVHFSGLQSLLLIYGCRTS